MRKIELTQGKVALVDDGDFEQLNAHKWCAVLDGRRWYATRRSSRASEGNGRIVWMHREIAGVLGLDVDHINGDGLDNRRENLRSATRSQNMTAFVFPRERKSSRYRGVSWDRARKRWRATAMSHGKYFALGRFTSEEDAARAYDTAARKFFGEFVCPNFKGAA